MQPEQQTSPEEQHPASNVDDLIAHTNAETHAFEDGSQKQSIGQHLTSLPKTRKTLLISGLVGVIFITVVIGLTLGIGKDSPKQNTLPTTAYGTADINGDGVIDEKDTVAIIKGDTNGDGVVDSRDDATANTTDAESASWWSSLFAKANSAISSGRSNDATDESTTADDSYEDADSEDDQIAVSDEADDPYTEEFDPDADPISEGENSVDAEYKDPVDTTLIPVPTIKGDTMLTVATWNVLGPHNDASKTKVGINTIFKHAQVIGLQEVGTSNNKKVRNIIKNLDSNGIGVYQPTGYTPIIWNARMYSLVASGYKEIFTFDKKRKVATHVKLQNKANGQQFYMFNIHLGTGAGSPKENCSTAACRRFKEQMQSFSKYITNTTKGSAIPIFATGDYNTDYRFDYKCDVSWRPCKAFKKLGMYSGYTSTKLASIGKDVSTYGKGNRRLVDYVFSHNRSNVVPISSKIIDQNSSCKKDRWGQDHCWYDSDHRPVLLTVQLKQ